MSGTTFGSILECQGLKFIINSNTQECMTIEELFEGPVGDYCIARNTIKCLFSVRTLHLSKIKGNNFVFFNFVGRAIHEVKYPRICLSSSNDDISAQRNNMLSQ